MRGSCPRKAMVDPRARRVRIGKFRQSPQPAPKAAGRPTLQQHRVGAAHYNHADLPLGPGPAPPPRRQSRDDALLVTSATGSNRAFTAFGLVADTDGGAEIHDGLRIVIDAFGWRM